MLHHCSSANFFLVQILLQKYTVNVYYFEVVDSSAVKGNYRRSPGAAHPVGPTNVLHSRSAMSQLGSARPRGSPTQAAARAQFSFLPFQEFV